MNEDLRVGMSTGTCAAGAAKAAALALRGELPAAVDVLLPDGDLVSLPVAAVERLSETTARASVVKDAGDDPDITNGMTVVVTLERTGEGIIFAAGAGVGMVTRPGLQIPPGEPAINPVPRQMIADAVRSVLGDAGVRVTVSMPGGAEVAAKTFNPRLGIEGGLSILGTSGRVAPKSEEAWLRSLLPQIDVARAAGHTTLYLVPGGFGESAAKAQLGAPESAVVQTSNFIGDMLLACTERGVEQAVLVGHAGKLVKVAAGIFNTHSRFGDARLETIAALAAAEGAPGPLVAQLLDLPTAEAAIPLLAEAGLAQVWNAIADRAAQRATAHAGIDVQCAIVGYEKELIGRSRGVSVTPSKIQNPKSKIEVVGVGPGPARWLTPAAWQRIRRAEVLVGGQRHLEQYMHPGIVEQIPIGVDLPAMVAGIRRNLGRRVVVLASGDPGFYGILATLQRELPEISLDVEPGISSVQLALARLAVPWESVTFASAHGKSLESVVEAAYQHPRVLALTDRAHTAQALAQALVDQGLNYKIVVLERLGYPDERLTRGTAEEVAAGEFDALAVVFVER